HLCRCTGWRTILEAAHLAAGARPAGPRARRPGAAARRAELEGGVPQRVGADVPLGAGGFADDGAPAGALVAVPVPAGGSPAPGATVRDVAGQAFVVAGTLLLA